MIFLGQVQHLVERPNYLKIVVAVECGYHVDCYTFRVAENTIPTLEVGDKVIFTGYAANNSAGLEQFKMETLVKRNFVSCPVCEFPLTSDVCLITHDKEAQKLIGQWKIVHKVVAKSGIKLFFEQGHYVFATVALPSQWTYSVFQELHVDDRVYLEGWRYQRHANLKFIAGMRYQAHTTLKYVEKIVE